MIFRGVHLLDPKCQTTGYLTRNAHYKKKKWIFQCCCVEKSSSWRFCVPAGTAMALVPLKLLGNWAKKWDRFVDGNDTILNFRLLVGHSQAKSEKCLTGHFRAGLATPLSLTSALTASQKRFGLSTKSSKYDRGKMCQRYTTTKCYVYIFITTLQTLLLLSRTSSHYSLINHRPTRISVVPGIFTFHCALQCYY